VAEVRVTGGQRDVSLWNADHERLIADRHRSLFMDWSYGPFEHWAVEFEHDGGAVALRRMVGALR
jgi:hypothetical protein